MKWRISYEWFYTTSFPDRGILSVRHRGSHRCGCPAIRGARVIDGSGGAAIDNAVIVIRDGRIVAIGPSAGTPVPSDAEVVDYSGKTIIPGLISDHSHVGIFVGLKSAPENYNRDSIPAAVEAAGGLWRYHCNGARP